MTTLHSTCECSIKWDILRELKRYEHIPEWICVSDYALSKGSKKPNRAFTFTFIPNLSYIPSVCSWAFSSFFEDDCFYNFLLNLLHRIVPSEIKHTRSVSPNFIWLLNNLPIINIAVVLENDKYLSLDSQDTFIATAINDLNEMHNTVIPRWIKNEPEKTADYEVYQKQIRAVLKLLRDRKKISLIKNIFLFTKIGAYLSSIIGNQTKATKWCWISDRDDVNDVANHFSCSLFNIYLNEFLENKNYQFYATPSGSDDDEWYVDLTKLPDYITGTLADYDMQNDKVSHDKFKPILSNHIADNIRNMHVLKLNFKAPVTCSRLLFHKIP